MKTNPLSLVIFVAGLAGAVASGVATYRAVGLYGGPVLTGFHREWDASAREYRLVHETTMKNGVHIRRYLANDLRVLRTDVSGATVGPAVAGMKDAEGVPMRIGFSTTGDGVIDAWSVSDPKTGVTRIEVSTKRDGRIDRWERYENQALVRVDLDTNGNGKADRWMTFEAGILMDTFIDADEDGKADDPPVR